MGVKLIAKWLSVALLAALCNADCRPVYGQLPSHASTVQTAFDSHALQLLDQMSDAYSHLLGLDQRTEFYIASIPISSPKVAPASVQDGGEGRAVPHIADAPAAPSPNAGGPATADHAASLETEEAPPGEKLKRSLQLIALRPNHLRLELREPDPGALKDQVAQWICDGKTFWTYTDEKHYYTREAAPSNLRDFPKLNHLDTGSLELLMLIGVNPFAQVREQVDSVRYLGEAKVRGVETEVVAMRAVQSTAITDARLYIGKSDHLLRRLVTETVPPAASKAAPGKVGDELDALVDGRPPPPPQTNVSTAQFATSESDPVEPEPEVTTGPMKMISSYDNIIHPLQKSYPSEFTFSIPEGALLYEPLQLQHNGFKQKRQSLMDLFRVAKVKKKRGKPRVVKGE
jgi:hypothetical protein